MKTFLLIVGLFPISLFSQTFAELNTDNETLKDYEWNTKENSKHVLDLYSCLKKNYKYNYKEDAFFNKKKEISIYNSIFFGDYTQRIQLQKKYKKCVKKSEITY